MGQTIVIFQPTSTTSIITYTNFNTGVLTGLEITIFRRYPVGIPSLKTWHPRIKSGIPKIVVQLKNYVDHCNKLWKICERRRRELKFARFIFVIKKSSLFLMFLGDMKNSKIIYIVTLKYSGIPSGYPPFKVWYPESKSGIPLISSPD